MSEIKINKEIMNYAQEFVPEAIRISRFLEKLTIVYEEGFRNYQGEAKQEIEAYKEQLLKQIEVLNTNYLALSQNLLIVIESFLEMDLQLKQTFYEGIERKVKTGRR